jgi:hypothetical protein
MLVSESCCFLGFFWEHLFMQSAFLLPYFLCVGNQPLNDELLNPPAAELRSLPHSGRKYIVIF